MFTFITIGINLKPFFNEFLEFCHSFFFEFMPDIIYSSLSYTGVECISYSIEVDPMNPKF